MKEQEIKIGSLVKLKLKRAAAFSDCHIGVVVQKHGLWRSVYWFDSSSSSVWHGYVDSDLELIP